MCLNFILNLKITHKNCWQCTKDMGFCFLFFQCECITFLWASTGTWKSPLVLQIAPMSVSNALTEPQALCAHICSVSETHDPALGLENGLTNKIESNYPPNFLFLTPCHQNIIFLNTCPTSHTSVASLSNFHSYIWRKD